MRSNAQLRLASMLTLATTLVYALVERDTSSVCTRCDDSICPPLWKSGSDHMSPLPLLQITNTSSGGTIEAFRYKGDHSTNLVYWFDYNHPGVTIDMKGYTSIIAVRYLKSVVPSNDDDEPRSTSKAHRRILTTRRLSTASHHDKRVDDNVIEKRSAPLPTDPIDLAKLQVKADDVFGEFQYFIVQAGVPCEVTSPIKSIGASDDAPLAFFAADVHYREFVGNDKA